MDLIFKVLTSNPLLVVILISLGSINLIKYFANKKFKRISLSNNRKYLYSKMLKTSIGRLFFIFKQIN